MSSGPEGSEERSSTCQTLRVRSLLVVPVVIHDMVQWQQCLYFQMLLSCQSHECSYFTPVSCSDWCI